MTNEKEWWREFDHECDSDCIENGHEFVLCLEEDEAKELIAESARRERERIIEIIEETEPSDDEVWDEYFEKFMKPTLIRKESLISRLKES